MKLYLIQHGHALSSDEDPDRPLSSQGTSDVTAISAYLDNLNVRVDTIIHSGKTRAMQSAMIARILTDNEISFMTGLDPNDQITSITSVLGSWDSDTMIIGHLPFLGKLAAFLVSEDESLPSFNFTPGTLLILESKSPGEWMVNSMIRPDSIPSR